VVKGERIADVCQIAEDAARTAHGCPHARTCGTVLFLPFKDNGSKPSALYVLDAVIQELAGSVVRVGMIQQRDSTGGFSRMIQQRDSAEGFSRGIQQGIQQRDSAGGFRMIQQRDSAEGFSRGFSRGIQQGIQQRDSAE